MWNSIDCPQLSLPLVLSLLALVLSLVLALRRWLLGRRAVACDAPGPPAWPLVGCHFSVDLPLWRWVERVGKARYGNVIKVSFPDHLAVVVSGYKELREVFLNESLLGRPQLPWRKQVGASGGLALSEGKLWRDHRTFSVRALNDFGWGSQAGQLDIAEESRQIVEEIRDHLQGRGEAELDPGDLVTQSVSAVISRMIFGCEQVAYDDRFYSKLPLIQSFDRVNRRTLAQMLLGRLAKLWPGRRLLRTRGGACARRPVEPVVEALRMCQDQIDKRRRSLRASDSDNGVGGSGGGASNKDYADYIEFYLREKANYFSEDEDEAPPAAAPAAPCMRDGRLAMTIFDLMTGGVEAVANQVRWALLLASLHPEAQVRLRAEIADAGGDATYAGDKDRLPYAVAFLEEVQRFVSLLPEGVIRRAVESTTIGGYHIPRGTRIIPNLYGMHHNPKYFPEPHRFLPDRFLRDGQFQPSKHLLSFSLGKRACPGEALARMEAFALVVAIIRSFSVALPADEAARIGELMRGCDGFVRRVGQHRLLFTELPVSQHPSSSSS